MDTYSVRKTASRAAREKHLKPLSLHEVKKMVLQGLQGHAEMASVGVFNSDQNLRNVMYDPAIKSIKLIDMGYAQIFSGREPWHGLDGNTRIVRGATSGGIVLQQWRDLGEFIFDDAERQSYWDFLEKIDTETESPEKALEMALGAGGFLAGGFLAGVVA